MDLTVLTHFVTLMLAISIAAERMVEILKGWLPNFWLFKTNPNSTKKAIRCAWIHVLAGVCGALVAGFSKVNVFAGLNGNAVPDPWCSSLAAGLLASGGS